MSSEPGIRFPSDDEIRAGLDHHAASDFDLSVRLAALREAVRRFLAVDDAAPDEKPDDMATAEWDAMVSEWKAARADVDRLLTDGAEPPTPEGDE